MRSAVYNKLMRYSTAGILGAIALIILATTLSTADWVVLFGKAMYWLVVALGIFSLILWAVRTRVGDGAGLPDSTLGETTGNEREA